MSGCITTSAKDGWNYLHCANGLLESRAGEALLGKVGKGVTSRNWGTTLKLAALV